MTSDSPPDLPFEMRARSVYLPDADAVVIADTHLGREADSNVELPLGATASIRDRLLDLVESFDPSAVVIAGDVLHSFSRVPNGVERDLERIREAVESRDATFVLVGGNHDAMLASIVDPVTEYRVGTDTVVCHGHERPGLDADRYVIGHEHPAIEVEGRRLPCHLWGRGIYEGSDVLALPAFDELAAGTEVNGLRGPDAQSPLLSDVDRFRPLVYDEGGAEPLVFPPLGEFRRYL